MQLDGCRALDDSAGMYIVQAAVERLGLITLACLTAEFVHSSKQGYENVVDGEGVADA